MTRIIVANFDAEIEMARAATPGPHPDLPRRVREHLAKQAERLSVLDPTATIVASAAEAIDLAGDSAEVLPWAWTESVAAIPRRLAAGGESWPGALWSEPGNWQATMACHDRRFWFRFAEARGELLPETSIITSLAELREKLESVTAASAEDAWIAKAPFSASGRERVYRWGADFPSDIETRLSRLFDRYGELVLEPMMKRTADFGVAGVITETGVQTRPPHRLHSDDAGVFRGIEPLADSPHLEVLIETARTAGEALAAAGHRGAFGIDAFEYTDTAGKSRLHSCNEINARLTFGHLGG